MNRKKDIIDTINKISGQYSPYEVFTDWIRCCALSIANSTTFFHGEVWRQRENDYIHTIKKYPKEDRVQFSEMLGMFAETLDEGETDLLGEIFMQSGMGSKAAGQFFTPFNLSGLCARLLLIDTVKGFDGKMITINEPTSGSGGMIIAAAKVLRDAGINYQKHLDVVAQDLDWKSVYMTYLQLSLLGIKAIVVQGNTLTEPYDPEQTPANRILITPAKRGLLL